MLYYNIGHERSRPSRHITTIITRAMSIRRPRSQPSILRLSALQRLGVAARLIALLWAAAFWAMR